MRRRTRLIPAFRTESMPEQLPPAVQVDTAVGPMLLHAHDRIITPAIRDTGTWEPDETAFLRANLQSGHLVVDIGANIGYFTLLAAHAVGPAGHVLAVEPEPRNLSLLRANIWRHRLGNVSVLAAAAGTDRGFLGLHEYVENNTGSYLGRPTWEADERAVPVVPLDEFVERFDVAKVDVQGADHEAIAGMQQALARNAAALVLTEFWLDGIRLRGTTPEQVLRSYRGSSRPLAILDIDGTPRPATDEEIIAACEASPGRYVNLVLGAVGS